jgi:hypothetical protein
MSGGYNIAEGKPAEVASQPAPPINIRRKP